MRILLAPLACLALAATTAAAARSPMHYVDIEVIDRDTGVVAETWHHAGQRWIAGTPGHRYTVRLSNRSGERVLAVLSVDGVNAVSGETASPQQAGYVLAPWQQTEVSGWRKNLSEVAQFEFTALSDSYAARTGRPGNVGVIGVAVFRERAPHYPPPRDAEIARQSAPAAPPMSGGADAAAANEGPTMRREAGKQRAIAPMPQESLGTGHGAREWSHARQVAFERASRDPVQVVALRYDSQRNLVAMGVIPAPPRPPRHRQPDPFPIGFVPDPAPRW